MHRDDDFRRSTFAMIAISITPPPMPSVVVINAVKPAQAIGKAAPRLPRRRRRSEFLEHQRKMIAVANRFAGV
jgi:hypothetical protein